STLRRAVRQLHVQMGALAHRGADLEGPAEQLDPLAHALEPAATLGASDLEIKAAAVVANVDRDPILLGPDSDPPQVNVDAPGLGVAGDVGQALLHDPIGRGLDPGVDPGLVEALEGSLDLDPGSLGEVVAVALDGALQAEV